MKETTGEGGGRGGELESLSALVLLLLLLFFPRRLCCFLDDGLVCAGVGFG